MTATSSSARPARRRFYVPAPNAFQPIATINTTPLIDLMLVLLIMFIISIPAATHKVPVDLPRPSPDQLQPTPVHRLGIDEAGGLSWPCRIRNCRFGCGRWPPIPLLPTCTSRRWRRPATSGSTRFWPR